ncbi:hypothetical protein A1OE_468 [Candidatus Endolissoclinum faulkneri L2]|uniref:Uncharacterized protein n=1 Tax=Candidatus Endolissoclinum faulkneri L2 TaxID=1193729 RepID=K7ZCK2_9PROT|nr:hypothetical protein A1OE_468 [Candidatus Endolissoclinum faulkneri L2]
MIKNRILYFKLQFLKYIIFFYIYIRRCNFIFLIIFYIIT